MNGAFCSTRAVSLALSTALAGCGGTPMARDTRESGQSQLMARAFAGHDRCQAKDATDSARARPFVIEWDGTDMSSFEGRAASDVVVVRYSGCNLEVLDACSDDTVRGKYGTYLPPVWTSGAVESLEISSADDLYAKLPLGAASLGGRVDAGEHFTMKYFVSGTRTATRNQLYRSELAGNPACVGATHFVYAYNVGAFSLDSQANGSATTSNKLGGAGVGADHSEHSHAVKSGGQLDSCQGSQAKDVATCRVPIRLTLRPLADGDNPQPTVAAPPAAASGRGNVEQATEHRAAAMRSFLARDGVACVREFDAADALDPAPGRVSTNPLGTLQTRSMCELLAGSCDQGRRDFRVTVEHNPNFTRPEQIDDQVRDISARFCTSKSGSAAEEAWRATTRMRIASQQRDGDACLAAYTALKGALPGWKPDPRDDGEMDRHRQASQVGQLAVPCLVAAKRCEDARRLWSDERQAAAPSKVPFETYYPTCKAAP